MIDLFSKKKIYKNKNFYDLVSRGETKKAIEWIEHNEKIINEKITTYGYTPFLTACYYGNYELIELLIEKGANIHQKDNYGRNAAYIAVMNNQINIMNDQMNILKKVFELGVDIDISIDDGYSPLTLAAYRNHLNVIEFLIQSGADVNFVANDELDFLFFVEQGNCKIDISYLLNRLDLFNEKNQKRIKKLRLKKVLEGSTFSGTTHH